MEHKYIIGIDAGTSKIKSVLIDKFGHELFTAEEDVRLITPAHGLVEQDMNEAWESTFRTVKTVLEKSGVAGEDVAAIAITGQADGIWLVGHDGEPVCNSYNWTDNRALSKCVEWIMTGVDQKLYEAISNTFYPGSQSCLTSWMIENEPEKLEATKWICICKDWLKFKLTGVMSSDDSYMMGHPKTRELSPSTYTLLGQDSVKDKFAQMRLMKDNHDPLLPEQAEKLGLKAGIPVFGGPFDFVACAIGTGTIHDGDACAIIGTTTNVTFAMTEFDNEPFNVGYTLCSAGPKMWIRAFGVMAGTPNLEWTIGHIGLKYILAAQQNGTDVYTEVEKAVREIPAGSGGIIYHPYALPGGERSPFVKPTAKAQFFGLGVEHTTDHMMRAVYEGVGYSLLDCLKCRPTLPKAITLMGGGSKSEFWCQLIADITGVDVVVAEGQEFGARGTAMAAGYAIGMFESIEEAVQLCVREKKRYVPDAANHALYEKYFELYRKIYHQMWDLWDLRAGLMQG